MRTLHSAAMTCKAVAEPASEALWAVLHNGALALLCPFPSFKIVAQEPADDFRAFLDTPQAIEYIFEGDVTDAQWQRWERCARLVRCIYLSDMFPPLQSPFFATLLRRQAGSGESLLPGLQGLWFSETRQTPTNTALIRALSTPTLSTFPFEPRISDDVRRWDSLRTLGSMIPCLQHLHIPTRGGAAIEYLGSILSFPMLRSLNLSLVSSDAYQALILDLAAMMDHLEKLYIATEGVHPTGPIIGYPNMIGAHRTLRGTENPPFPVLRELRIVGKHSDIVQLLTLIPTSSIEKVSLISNQPHITEVAPMLNLLASKPNTTSLQFLHICLCSGFYTLADGDEPVHAYFSSVLKSLWNLRALKPLRIESQCRILSISDEDVANMGRSWPLVQSLVITCDTGLPDILLALWTPYIPYIIRPSLTALVELAGRCRTLERLMMDVTDVSEEELVALEAYNPEEDATPPQTQLLHLIPAQGDHCFHLYIPDVDRLGRALLRRFPNLEGLSLNGWFKLGKVPRNL
ncbi:hypothetical protein C8Q78DRAFT_541781 [Trametes maxima]|nr:hypothetical protein C8Q78DRAFT_541781 [Trametes maxima]